MKNRIYFLWCRDYHTSHTLYILDVGKAISRVAGMCIIRGSSESLPAKLRNMRGILEGGELTGTGE